MTANPSISRGFYVRFGKRCLDFAIASLALSALLPVLIAISLLILVVDGWPIFFHQRRTGLHGVPFDIWKFRTMTGQPKPDASLVTAKGDSRVTPLGRWLRRTKCDELPQLWNVLRGDMSLVGPRPEVPRYTDRYTPTQRQVLDIRSGITGPTANQYIGEEELLAQQADKEAYYVQVLLPVKLESDLAYSRSISFNEDLKLIAKTVANLLFKFPQNSRLLFPGSTTAQQIPESRESSRGAA